MELTVTKVYMALFHWSQIMFKYEKLLKWTCRKRMVYCRCLV